MSDLQDLFAFLSTHDQDAPPDAVLALMTIRTRLGRPLDSATYTALLLAILG